MYTAERSLLARAAVDFFNQINMLCALASATRLPSYRPLTRIPFSHRRYGTVTEFCTPQECPMMCAGPR